MVLEQMMLERLCNEVRTLKSEKSSLESTIKDKDAKINELKVALEVKEIKYKIKYVLSLVKEEFIIQLYDYECIRPEELEDFLYTFIVKYEAM